MQQQAKQTRLTKPKFDIPKVALSMGSGTIGGIEIAMVSDFEVSDSLFMSAFRLTEVDQPPRPVRTFPPQYPYIAKRDNIEGRVMLKFVVDTDGLAKEPRVEESVPEGVFDEAALKALERYRFRPAIKNGKTVLCIVRLPISFRLK
jgi:protein TonB